MDTNTLYEYRTEQHIIKPSKEIYSLLDNLTFKSKNLYNLGLHEQRSIFFEYNKTTDYNSLYYLIKNTEAFKALPCAISQQIIRQLCTDFKSFHRSSLDYSRNPSKYTGKPKLPKYKHKTKGRNRITFNNQNCRLKDGYIHFHKILEGFTIKTKITELVEVRIIPRNNHFILEAVGCKTIEQPKLPNKNIASIDLGIDNFSTITIFGTKINPLILNGKGLKSYNKYFNKKLAVLKSEAKTRHNLHSTNRIEALYDKRNRYFKNFMHQASRKTINHLVCNGVSHLVIGQNKDWKRSSKLKTEVNQTFIQIPYQQYIDQLIYKAREQGIKVYIVEESYTSGTSFLDNEQPNESNYNKSRRIHRGLFISNTGIKINADVNASYQIMKKVFPTLSLELCNGIDGCGLHPSILNVI